MRLDEKNPADTQDWQAGLAGETESGDSRLRPRSRLRRDRRGLSLLEIVVVAAIIAVLAGLGLPIFSQTMQTRRLSAATRQVTGDLRSLQSLAISQGSLFRFHSGTDPGINLINQYRLERSTDDGATWTPIGPWTDLSADFSGVGFTMRDTANTMLHEVRFNARGAAIHPGSSNYPYSVNVSGVVGGQPRTSTIMVRRTGSVKAP